MARRWSSARRVADMRCVMRVTPAPHMRVNHRCAAAEGSAGEGGFFNTHNEGGRCLHTRSYTRSPRELPCSCMHFFGESACPTTDGPSTAFFSPNFNRMSSCYSVTCPIAPPGGFSGGVLSLSFPSPLVP